MTPSAAFSGSGLSNNDAATRSTQGELVHTVPETVVVSDLVLLVSSDSAIAPFGSAVTTSTSLSGALGVTVMTAVTTVESPAAPLAPKSPVQSNVLPAGSTVRFCRQLNPFVAVTAALPTPVCGSSTRTTAPVAPEVPRLLTMLVYVNWCERLTGSGLSVIDTTFRSVAAGPTDVVTLDSLLFDCASPPPLTSAVL